MTSPEKQLANAKKVYNITKQDLPLSCPTNKMTLWNSHPKVYLPIEKTSRKVCPYCSSCFILQDD